MLKRTPGKWKISKLGDIKTGEDKDVLDIFRGFDVTEKEHEGNMALIVNAPEMYELLCRIADYESYIDTKLVLDAQSLVKRINVERQDKRR